MANSTDTTTEGLATVTDAARYLAVHRSTIWRLIESGKLEKRFSGRMTRVTWDSIKRHAGLS